MVRILASLILILGVIFAQPMMNQPNRPIVQDNPRMYHDMTSKQNPKEMVETIRIYKITEELGLTEDQNVRFFPKLKELRDIKEDFNQNRIKLAERLNGCMNDPKKVSADIKSLVAELEANENRLREKEARIKKDIANILTPEQQAKFMLFTMRFNQEMREMVGKARDMHRDMQDMRKGQSEEQKPKRWRF